MASTFWLKLLLYVALMLVSLPASLAWGPLSHGVMNCGGIFPGKSVGDCLQQPRQVSFLIGSDMPDVFAFSEFNISTSSSQWGCHNLSYVHDPIFGGEQLLLALNYSGEFDAVNFSKAFVGHVIGDLVGFNPAGGILCSTKSGGCSNADILYVPEWGYMAALDALFYVNFSLDATQLSTSSSLTEDAFQFMADSTQAYHHMDPSFQAVDVVAIKECATYWAGNMEYVYQRGNV